MISNSKILIVEDDRTSADLLSRWLLLLGFEISGIFPKGEDALAAVEKAEPDLILMDIMLAGNIDGIETAMIVKEKFSVPVIFLTALSDESAIQRAKAAEPYGYLMKPFAKKDLQASIEIALYRRKMERQLIESEIWFRTTLSSIGDGVIATDNENKIRFTNSVFDKLGGFLPNECIGKKLEDVYETQHDTTTEGLLYQSLEFDPDSFDEPLQHKILVTKDNRQIPIEEKISSIKSADGKILGKVISLRDTTKRREAQLRALKAKDYYLKFFEEFPILIWRTNKRGESDYFNPTWLEFTGRNIESQLYNGWLDGIHPEDRERFNNAFAESLSKKEKFEIEFRLRSCDAEYHWLACVCNPFYDLENNFEGFIGLCFDIHNRIMLEEELTQSRDTFDAANKAKSTFISIMSHEIRTPLNGIACLIDLLAETKLNPEQSEYLEMIKQSSNTLLGLLNNLLNFSKLEEKKVVLEESKFNLRERVNEILLPYKTQAKRSGVKLNLNVDERIPELIIGDELKLQQIIFNLLSNSVKFTEKGSIDLSFEIDDSILSRSVKTDVIYLHIKVADTGIGIAREKLGMIFESFTQVDNSMTRKFSGSGLGLSIVKKLAELMKGRVWVESELGKGSVFHFVCEVKTERESLFDLTQLN